jgi:uncharacterized damage-inducible protein DinB
MNELADGILTIARNRITRELPPQITECLDVLDEAQVWWRPNDASNAVGNLVIHLCGATRHFLGRGVGGSEYVRDRDGEFAERGPIPKAALRTLLDGTVAEADRVIGALTPERLLEPTRNIDAQMTVLQCLMRMSHHWAYHTGQIVFVTKMLRAGSVSDLFRRTMVK